MTYSVTQFWQSSSLGLKLVLGVGLLVIILVTFGTTRSCVSAYKDRAHDEKQAELKAESDAHRARADEWEAKAREYGAQAKLAEVAVQVAGAKAEAIAEKVKVADEELVKEMERIGAPVDDPCERVRRVCVRLAIKPADCLCTSN